MSISIDRQIVSRTVGENDGVSQVFIQNNIPYIFEPDTEHKLFSVPLFNLQGATFNYYEQSIDGISVNINNQKSLLYTYTANTDSFSAITRTIYDVYRVDFNTYDAVYNNLDEEGDETTSTTGSTPTKQTISALLSNPLVTLYDTGSTITVPTYTYSLPEIVKPENDFAQPLLVDKSQYFVDTRFEFIQERDRTLGGFQTLSGGSVIDFTYSGLTTAENNLSGFTVGDFLLETSRNSEEINQGVFSGFTVNGALFTYFVAPQKPNIDVVNDEPTVQGELDTFSPIFSFNNVSDGDYYRLQVTYDLNDVTFSGAVNFTIPQQEGIPDFIRTYSTPLSPDSSFLYRIGNTKEIINVFGVKQNVTTWGRSEQAFTATDGIYDVSGTIFQDELYGSPVSGATVKFIVVSTTADVELGADAPYDAAIPEGTFEPLGGGAGASFSAITDENGNYSVTDIKGGTLTVEVSHPLYETTYHTTTINSDTTDADFTIILRWGSTTTTFGDVQGQLFI
jgi:hypothetical protein